MGLICGLPPRSFQVIRGKFASPQRLSKLDCRSGPALSNDRQPAQEPDCLYQRVRRQLLPDSPFGLSG